MHQVLKSGPMGRIAAANRAAGHHYFSEDTMRFFASRMSATVHVGPGGTYFVSSERCTWGAGIARKYTVREALPDGTIGERGSEFQAFATSAQAHRFAKRCAKGDKRHYHVLQGLQGCYMPNSSMVATSLRQARACAAESARMAREDGERVRGSARARYYQVGDCSCIEINSCSEPDCLRDMDLV